MKPICAGPGFDLRDAFGLGGRDTLAVTVADGERIEVPEQDVIQDDEVYEVRQVLNSKKIEMKLVIEWLELFAGSSLSLHYLRQEGGLTFSHS